MGHEYEQLIGFGFTAGGDGVLHAPAGSVVTLKPIAPAYYELTIGLGGNVVSCIVSSVALKFAPAGEAEIDPAALISGTPRCRPW